MMVRFPGRHKDINWEPGCIDCDLWAPLAFVLTLFAMLTHVPAMIRYVHTGEEPK